MHIPSLIVCYPGQAGLRIDLKAESPPEAAGAIRTRASRQSQSIDEAERLFHICASNYRVVRLLGGDRRGTSSDGLTARIEIGCSGDVDELRASIVVDAGGGTRTEDGQRMSRSRRTYIGRIERNV